MFLSCVMSVAVYQVEIINHKFENKLLEAKKYNSLTNVTKLNAENNGNVGNVIIIN